MSHLVQAEITGHADPAPGVRMLEFYAPQVASAAQPGQFLHVRCGSGSDPLLRRPISIHAVSRGAGLVRILFQVAGRGTTLLADRQEGLLDVMGPLGRGFRGPVMQNPINTVEENKNDDKPDGSIIVLGGGMGAAPLYFLLQHLAGTALATRVKVLLGAGSADRLLIVDQAAVMGFEAQVATDDGSAGFAGLVTHLLEGELRHKTAYVYACGPGPMLKAACTLLDKAGVPGEVLLEERMACGVGACLSCACLVREPGGEETYRRACVDGPVFNAREVVWK